jgi:Flp pilus assembly protein CpaB
VAFALSIKLQTGVAALIAPGDRVDLIGRLDDDQETIDSILLTDVPVIGQAGEPPLAEEPPVDVTPTPQPPNAPRILILDLPPDQAARLAQAIEIGNVYVALRSSRR